jgi:hypothetical protein
LMMEPSWILRPIPDLREKLEMRAKEIEFRNVISFKVVMSSDCVSLGVPHRDRDDPQLRLSKSPVEPRSFALLVVLQDHSRRRRRSFCSSALVRSLGSIGQLYWPHFDFAQIRFISTKSMSKTDQPSSSSLRTALAFELPAIHARLATTETPTYIANCQHLPTTSQPIFF